MKTIVWAIGVLLCASTAGAQNLCAETKPAVSTAASSSRATATVPDMNLKTSTGQDAVTDLDISVFAFGVIPQETTVPVMTRLVPKVNWTLVSGTVDCYVTAAGWLATVPTGAVFDMYVRKNGPGGKGQWSTSPVTFRTSECSDGATRYPLGTNKKWKFTVASADAAVDTLLASGWNMTSVRVTTTYWWWTGVCGR